MLSCPCLQAPSGPALLSEALCGCENGSAPPDPMRPLPLSLLSAALGAFVEAECREAAARCVFNMLPFIEAAGVALK